MKPVQFQVKMLTTLGLAAALFAHTATGEETNVLDHDVRKLGSDEVVNLKEAYEGKVVLIVNTASKCAFTGQYEGLEALYKKYAERGLVVLGFPSNDFGAQEPGTETEIQNFCRLTYSVQFPMFAKTRVRKGFADPLCRTRSCAGRPCGCGARNRCRSLRSSTTARWPSRASWSTSRPSARPQGATRSGISTNT